MFEMNNSEEVKRCPKVKVNLCPHCKEQRIIKYGKYNGEQRYQCKNCKKTFSARTNTPWYYSKKSLETWIKYYYYMFNINSLRECAVKLKINLSTSFHWRHKILAALESDFNVEELIGAVHIQKRIIKENRKGQKGITSIPQRNIWIYFSIDNQDGIIGNPTCLDRWNYDNFIKSIYNKINKNAYIEGIGDRFVKLIAAKHNESIKKNIESDNINTINHIIGKFSELLCKYHGVASKYIRRYMALIKLLSMKAEFKISEIIENIFGRNFYKKILKIREEDIIKI